MGTSESKSEDRELLEEYLLANADYQDFTDQVSTIFSSVLIPGRSSWCHVDRGTIINDLLSESQAGKLS